MNTHVGKLRRLIDKAQIKALRRRATRAEAHRDWEKASNLYINISSFDPNNVSLLMKAGHMCKAATRYALAEQYYTAARDLLPNNVDIHLQLGHLYKMTDRLSDAFRSYEAAYELEPDNVEVKWEYQFTGIQLDVDGLHIDLPEALIAIADRARDAKDWHKAARYYEAYLDRRPDDGAIWMQAGHMRKEYGEFSNAERHYLKARALMPEDGDLHLQFGHLYKITGNLNAALAAYKEALAYSSVEQLAAKEYRNLTSFIDENQIIDFSEQDLYFIDRNEGGQILIDNRDNFNQTGLLHCTNKQASTVQNIHYYINIDSPARLPIDEMVSKLSAYDVISFDIFDTAIVRAVARPDDVFRLMGVRLGVTDFVRKRKEAESYARAWKDRLKGTREVTLGEIYDVLRERGGATDKWKRFEERLEIHLARTNPYILNVYKQLLALGKTIVFTSDMYLSMETIEAMLARAGYKGYAQVYLSNEHAARKGDGTLQAILLADYSAGHSIVHVGDVYEADVTKSIAAGIDAVHSPNQHSLVPEKDMGSIAGSFYEAVINNAIGTGVWSKGLHYTHGFRVGGILALGYVQFLDRLSKEKGVERVLFLGRDCHVLSQIYLRFFDGIPSVYVDTSRTASLMLTTDKNFDDYIGRTFFRWYKESNNSRPLRQLLSETGFEYLIEHLELADIEPLLLPAGIDEQRLREFFWANKFLIDEHLADTRDLAKEYFAEAIGGAKSVLLVDIGWTGTCITVLRDFFQTAFGSEGPLVFGALLATSRNAQVGDAISSGLISSYIYSPVMNQDITRLMMPAGNVPQSQKDLLTLPVEYLFTEPKATTIGYVRDTSGKVASQRGGNSPTNPEQISDMQKGMIDFVKLYLSYSSGFKDVRSINSYSAFQPLRNSYGHRPYLYAVYKDFLYDAVPIRNGDGSVFGKFGDLFSADDQKIAISATRGETELFPETVDIELQPKILFVTPELTYTGTPHSLLRLCRVAEALGYTPIVWSAKSGPFAREFESNGYPVSIVSSDIGPGRIRTLIKDNVKLVVCNTVVTDQYVKALEGQLPLVWYVREATNLPQFLRGNLSRSETLRRSACITVVSDYAAAAVKSFTEGPVTVVKNAVEDVSNFALPYSPKSEDVTRFVQLGTIEHRKGYDLFIAAYKAMPEEYRARAELHFAGGFINSGTSFASFIFGQANDDPRIKYHGLIAGVREKVELLSQMDVVVVASRDESCSLVALEGAMLSKPLILTENVGAKYIVAEDSGIVIPSGSVDALRNAFMELIDLNADKLAEMGNVSRIRYNTLASMDAHQLDLSELFEERITTGPVKPLPAKPLSDDVAHPMERSEQVIVSLTSFPPRMPTIAACIATLKDQSLQPDRILLWLSKDQFPNQEADLPADLLDLVDSLFTIRWVLGDIGPHKKYFYAMQEFPDACVVIFDDDVRYDPELVATLYKGHLDYPQAVVALRSNLIRFRPDGTLRKYEQWGYDYQHLRQTEVYSLLPTGIGGVLYPPRSIPVEAFDLDAIQAHCGHADDLWLKIMATANGYPVVMPHGKFDYRNIDGSQAAALWRINAFHNGNDYAMTRILDFVEKRYGIAANIVHRIWGVRTDASFFGPGDSIDRDPLFPRYDRNVSRYDAGIVDRRNQSS